MTRIALLGFGNVGRAFVRHLYATGENETFQVFGIADITGGLLLANAEDGVGILEILDPAQGIENCASRGTFLDVPAYLEALPAAGISVLVECLPTNPKDGQPALDYIRGVLDRGISVVTVDKGPIAHGFHLLRDAALSKGARLAYGGTTGVRPPSGIDDCHVLEIRGVLNGTTNFILTQMQTPGTTFDQALAQAEALGIAEPNSALDLQGWDTASKLLILANEWMNADAVLGDVVRIGIGPETEELVRSARESGRVVRLVGRSRYWEGRVRLSVAPKIVGPESALYSISGTSKIAVFRTREKGEILSTGISGRDAIAATILEDLRAVTSSSKG